MNRQTKPLPNKKNEQGMGARIRQTIALLLLALASISAASYAWFSIADRTRVRSMDLEITSGASLRFDLQAHNTFEEYVKTLSFDEISSKIASEYGFDPRGEEKGLEPVTTTDYIHYTLEKGKAVETSEGKYLEFQLHFMATGDMVVHLTADNSAEKQDGTLVETDLGSPSAMRISFTSDQGTAVYQPQHASGNTFTLPAAGSTQYGTDNALFTLEANTDLPVMVHVWLEGEDAACTDDMRGSKYKIRLRFIGTDENGNLTE